MRIEVTQEHIDKGVMGDCEDCPIARAIRAVGIDASVQDHVMLIGDRTVVVGPFLFSRMFQFDNGYGMDPFSFELEVP